MHDLLVGHHPSHGGDVVAASSQVELIRFPDELDDPGKVQLVEGSDRRAHLQAAVEVFDARRRALEPSAVPGPGPCRAISILACERARLEVEVLG